uniref:TRAF3-interacting protein 1 C-terminal domain-containing protein n=1 Tax=Rhabditophanes sp. KR3021 TaxID=114890 RepID=A0AC35TXU7_9BILA
MEQKNIDLFSKLIKTPVLTSPLLKRPPFRFLFDIISETIKETKYLSDEYGELNFEKFGDKNDKIKLLDGLIGRVNDDGKLNELKGSKIVAGKDAELTNLFLQKFGKAAKLFKKEKKKDGGSKKKEKDGGEEKSKKKATKIIPTDTEEDKKEKKKVKKDPTGDKKKKDTVVDKKKKDDTKSKKKKIGKEEDPINDSNTPDKSPQPSPKELPSEKLPILISPQTEKPPPAPPKVQPNVENNVGLPLPKPVATPVANLVRPGTAVSRPPPPKLKKNPVVYEDPGGKAEEVVAIPIPLMVESEGDGEMDLDDFISEEPLNNLLNEPQVNINKINEDQHGLLVNKIVENTKDLEKSAMAATKSDFVYDDNEYRRLKQETDEIRQSVQKLSQTIHPLSQIFDFIQEDFDGMLRELDLWWKEITKNSEELRQKQRQLMALDTQEKILRSLGVDIEEKKREILVARAAIDRNDKVIENCLITQ